MQSMIPKNSYLIYSLFALGWQNSDHLHPIFSLMQSQLSLLEQLLHVSFDLNNLVFFFIWEKQKILIKFLENIAKQISKFFQLNFVKKKIKKKCVEIDNLNFTYSKWRHTKKMDSYSRELSALIRMHTREKKKSIYLLNLLTHHV